MNQDINELTGLQRGPTSIVLVGVHGNETGGVEALKKLLPRLKIERGRILFGHGNPPAIEANRRFIEANLNRLFKGDNMLSQEEKASYEYKRAQFLKTCLNQADALLDIHASNTPRSKPFIICEANAKGITEYLPADLVVSGFNKVEPGATDGYMNSIGKMGICVECGYLGDSQSARVAEESIFAFLKARGHIVNDINPREQSYIRMYDLYVTKTNKFVLSKPFDDFEKISKGQVIGTDGEKEVGAERDGVILFARDREQIGDEAFLLGEKKNSLA